MRQFLCIHGRRHDKLVFTDQQRIAIHKIVGLNILIFHDKTGNERIRFVYLPVKLGQCIQFVLKRLSVDIFCVIGFVVDVLILTKPISQNSKQRKV